MANGSRSRIGLALAGGGLEGAVYEIGALRALDECLEGVDFNSFDIYVGVSAGSFLAGNLANQLTTAQMCRAIVKQEPGEHPFQSEIFLTPATRELVRSGAAVPRLFVEALRKYVASPGDRTLLDAMTRLGRALPVGVFENDRIRAYLQKIYSMKGRTDDFRELSAHLFVVAVDLDSGQPRRFGEAGDGHVPISKAVQASTALPGVYPPVEIEGRHYVDGVLSKTLHASVALDDGAGLVLCINPIVPVDTAKAVERGVMERGQLMRRGLPSVLSQMLRTMIHSRLNVGLASYDGRYDGDVVLIEPRRDDYRMFFNNIFSWSSRRDVCEYAYKATRRDLRTRVDELEPILERHGIGIRRGVLDDRERDLWTHVGLVNTNGRLSLPPPPATGEKLDRLLDRLDEVVS